MTRPPLRLVFDAGEHATPTVLELPPGATSIHVHLHIGTLDRLEPPPAAARQGRSERKPWRFLALGIVGVAVIMFVSLDLGARMGEGHANALAVSRASISGLASLIPGIPTTPSRTSSSELPATVRQQLAQRPTITPPLPADQQSAGGANPFGLHP